MDALPCSPADYIRVRDAFLAARDADLPRREQMLKTWEQSDPDLAAMVRAMLDLADEQAMLHGDGRVAAKARPVASLIANALGANSSGSGVDDRAVAPTPLPEINDRYRVVARLSRGSAAEVLRAEQVTPIVRTVAIKLFNERDEPAWTGAHARSDDRTAFIRRAALRRFEREARVLALLDHPGIARVSDAGVAKDGRRFLAMEFVDGLPIDRACDALQLDARGRIELILEVCRAVEHAHGRGVIHRDLKPSNILVTVPAQDDARVKVIDFGIARLQEPDGSAETRLTLEGQLFGTLAYMSPEQLAGQPADVRSDVYALGVILCQLITGRRLAIGRQLAVPECDGRVDLSRGVAAHFRRRRDLAAIIDKAAASSAADRYPSAAALAADLSRLLDDRTIEARPSRWHERVLLAARRAPLVTALVIISAVASLSAVAAVVISRDRLSQQINAQQAELAHMLDTVLDALHPLVGATDARRALAESLLARTEALIAMEPDDAKLQSARARLVAALGDVAMESGDLARARLLRTEAMQAFERLSLRHPEDPSLARRHAQALVLMGDIDYELGARDAARAPYRRAFEILLAARERHPDHIGLVDDLSWAHDRLWTEEELRADPERVLAIVQARLDLAKDLVARSPDRSLSVYSLMEAHRRKAIAHATLSRTAEAFTHFREAVTLGQELVAREPRRFHFRMHLGHTLCLAARCARSLGDSASAWQWLQAAEATSAAVLAMEPDRIEAIGLRISERRQRAAWHGDYRDFHAMEACRSEVEQLVERLERLQRGPSATTTDARADGWVSSMPTSSLTPDVP